MREKHSLQFLILLNVALAAAFVVYVLVSRAPQPEIIATDASRSWVSNALPRHAEVPAAPAATNAPPAASQPARTAGDGAHSGIRSAAAPPGVTPASRRFTWRDVEEDEYPAYLDNLRRSGCPEETVQKIAQSDIDHFIAQKRLQEAIQHDPQWWTSDANRWLEFTPQLFHERVQRLEEQRRQLVVKLLGAAALPTGQPELPEKVIANLTGPVLGAFSLEKYCAVQELGTKAWERRQNALNAAFVAGESLSKIEEGRLRELTRVEMRRLLSADEMDHYLLRNSHNATTLREELRGMNPTAEEFLKVFRVIDPIDHALQLEFGAPETMSASQRERWQRRREAAIKDVLAPERFADFLLTKDPLFQQAQMLAVQYGASAKVVKPFYEVMKALEPRRQQVRNDKALTPEQMNQQLQALEGEQRQRIRTILEASRGTL